VKRDDSRTRVLARSTLRIAPPSAAEALFGWNLLCCRRIAWDWVNIRVDEFSEHSASDVPTTRKQRLSGAYGAIVLRDPEKTFYL
jgi:hypothetical protein